SLAARHVAGLALAGARALAADPVDAEPDGTVRIGPARRHAQREDEGGAAPALSSEIGLGRADEGPASIFAQRDRGGEPVQRRPARCEQGRLLGPARAHANERPRDTSV